MRFALYLFAVSGLLALGAGCYNPKANIDAFSPQAEKLIHQKIKRSLPGAGVPSFW